MLSIQPVLIEDFNMAELILREKGPRKQLKQLQIVHDDILNHLIAHPKTPRKELARLFGFSETQISFITHSDIFQARLMERREQIYNTEVAPLREKLNHIAHEALDKLATSIPIQTDPKEVRETAKMVLDRLGYAPKSNKPVSGNVTNIQNNSYNVSPDVLRSARDRFGAQPTTKEVQNAIEHTCGS